MLQHRLRITVIKDRPRHPPGRIKGVFQDLRHRPVSEDGTEFRTS